LRTNCKPEDGIAFFRTLSATLALFPYGKVVGDVGPGWNVTRTASGRKARRRVLAGRRQSVGRDAIGQRR
jgi:hypothetical protein